MSLESQVAIVTGASRGIGQAIAVRLASEGAKVAVVATSESNGAGTVSQIQENGGEAIAYGADVSSMEDSEQLIQRVSEQLGAPSILVNNAGITRDSLLLRMSEDDWDAVITTNLKSCFNLTKAVAKGMMKARSGRIINISSIVGLHGAAGQANYAASKAGIIGFTLASAKELGSRGITCNAIAPGFIETAMTAELSEEMRNGVVQGAPLGRLGSPEDIAGVVAFLAGPDSSYMTGQVLTVDGGLSL